MKEIKLTRGQVALVDDEDYEWLSQHKWYAMYNKNQDVFYAVRCKKGGHSPVLMHRFIMGVEDPKIFVDHKFHNTLDNQRCNLRKCTARQNQMNRRKRDNCFSVFKGVTRRATKSNKPCWIAQIRLDSKQYTLGRYTSEEAAAIAYNKKADELFGEFAVLNNLNPEQVKIAEDSLKNKKTSKYRGVSFHAESKTWFSQARKNGVNYYLGRYKTEEEAYLKYVEFTSLE